MGRRYEKCARCVPYQTHIETRMEVIASLPPPPPFLLLPSLLFFSTSSLKRRPCSPCSLSPQFAEVALKNGLKPFLGKNRFDEFPQQ